MPEKDAIFNFEQLLKENENIRTFLEYDSKAKKQFPFILAYKAGWRMFFDLDDSFNEEIFQDVKSLYYSAHDKKKADGSHFEHIELDHLAGHILRYVRGQLEIVRKRDVLIKKLNLEKVKGIDGVDLSLQSTNISKEGYVLEGKAVVPLEKITGEFSVDNIKSQLENQVSEYVETGKLFKFPTLGDLPEYTKERNIDFNGILDDKIGVSEFIMIDSEAKIKGNDLVFIYRLKSDLGRTESLDNLWRERSIRGGVHDILTAINYGFEVDFNTFEREKPKMSKDMKKYHKERGDSFSDIQMKMEQKLFEKVEDKLKEAYTKAVSELETSLKDKPNNAQDHFKLGLLYLITDMDKAKEHLQQAIYLGYKTGQGNELWNLNYACEKLR